MSVFRRLLKGVMVPVNKIIQKADLWMIKISYVGHIEGISICDNSIVQRSPIEFLKATKEAMVLIRDLDLRRYRRICREFDYIVNKELAGLGDFQWKLKICQVDYAKLSRKTKQQWCIRRYASVLIHEATHGVIAKRGILYNRSNRLRIERLCHQEQYRFARHFEPDYADTDIGPFKPEGWKQAWGAQQDRTAASWKRLWKSLKELYFKRSK